MKVLLINGSPHEKGCTYTALNIIKEEFIKEGIDSEIYYIGNDPIAPCRACYACANLKRCVIEDKVNEFVDYAKDFDGYIVGSPVHYASASGNVVPFLHRAFFCASRAGSPFAHKPANAIVSARRAGTTATIDQLNKYFQIQQMPVISGKYWNMVHGSKPEDVYKDEESVQNLQILARNFAWHLKCREAGLKAGITPPQTPEIVRTNFIR